MAISAATYHTSSFAEVVPPPQEKYHKGQAKEEDAAFVVLATSLGQYFEGKFYEELSKRAGEGGSMNTTSQAAAKRLFAANAISTYKGMVLRPQHIRQLIDVANSQAASLASKVHEEIMNGMEENSNKNYHVEQVGDTDRILGDIKVVVNNKTVIYEVKYQLYSGARVRYQELSDANFNGSHTFAEWLGATPERRERYWGYKKRPKVWKLDIRGEALGEFMWLKDGNIESFRRMLQKGLKDNAYDAKKIVYASNLALGKEQQRAETILDLEALREWVEINKVKYVQDNAHYRILAAEEEIGTFGISKFQKGDPGTEPAASNFTFEMYLAQKLFI